MRISEQFSCKPRSPGIVLTIFLLFATGMIANAQQGGMISGRVVNDEGEGLANVNIRFTRILTGRRVDRDGGNTKTITEKDGNFRATGLAPGLYSVDVSNTKEYAMKPLTSAERRVQRYYRTGDNITIELVKGGVITGKVTNSDGRPMVEVEVSETMVRDAEGHALRGSRRGEPRMTDDRGIYRMFRLQPGSYIISTNGRKMFGPTDDDSVTTYHPSSTFDTATEVTVTSGSEITGVDIRIRDDPGYVVSGTVTASSVTPSSVYIDLISTNLSSVAQSTGFRPDSRKGFIIEGVTNGDYEIMAFGRDNNNELVAASTPRRITVSGADVPGLELKLSALASLSGQILIEASSDPCENKSKRALEEIMIYARSDDPSIPAFPLSAVVNEKREFTFASLRQNRYRIEASLPDENWYLKTIALSSPAAGTRDISRAGLALRAGDKITGVTVTVAQGAASLRGKVAVEKEGASLPSRLRVHLAPVETALTDDILRYAEVLMNNDGTFTFTNIAPGRYWLLLRPVAEDEPADLKPRSSAWDGNERAKLRREAEAMKIEVALKPCQRVRDFSIKF